MTIVGLGKSDFRIPAQPGAEEAPRSQKPAKPDVGTTSITLKPEGMSHDEQKEWTKGQISWPNLASNGDIATRAVNAVRWQRAFWKQHADPHMAEWKLQDQMMEGKTRSGYAGADESNIHVPYLVNAREAIVPRVEEGLFLYEPWFHVRGRDRMDRSKAHQIRELLRYYLDLAKFDATRQDQLRTGIHYPYVVLKVYWDQQWRWQIQREMEMDSKAGLPVIKRTTALEEMCVYEGPRIEMVDPFSFFYDPRRADHQRGFFCGDVAYWTLDQILAYGEEMGWKNLDQVRKLEPRGRSTQQDDKHQEAALPMAPAGMPKEYLVASSWCLFAPRDGEPMQEHVLTVIEDQVAVCVRRNFHDDQHRPYCVGRSGRNAFTLLDKNAIGLAVPLNIEADRLRYLMLRNFELHQSPMVLVKDQGGNLPDNLLERRPGDTFKGVGDVQVMNIPSALEAGIAAMSLVRRDLEDTLGVPPVIQGNDQSNTATQAVTNQQEANRRIRGLIQSFAGMYSQMLGQLYALVCQFQTDEKEIEVMGKDAVTTLGQRTKIGPQHLGDPVDFTFPAIAGLQSLNMRGTQAATFVSQIGGFIEQASGSVDIPGLIYYLAELNGLTTWAPEIVRRPPSLDRMFSQDQENLMLLAGHSVPIHPNDDAAGHLQSMRELRAALEESGAWDKLPPQTVESWERHEVEHEGQLAQQGVREQALGSTQPSYETPRDAEQRRLGVAAEGAEQRPASAQKGRNGREMDLMGPVTGGQTPPGETPGPARAGSIASPDREPAFAQTTNRR